MGAQYLINTISSLYLQMSIPNNIVSTKIYDKRDDFDCEIVNFPFIDGDVFNAFVMLQYPAMLLTSTVPINC